MTYENLNVVNIVVNKITEEIQAILNLDPQTYAGYNVIVTNERQFVKKQDAKPKSIFVVIKFLQGNRDHGQQAQPITIEAISEHNSLTVTQKLMMDFAETYNLRLEFNNDGYTLRQSLTTVSNVSNFNEVYDGFRSLFYMSGTFYIGVNSNPIASIIIQDANGLNEEIDFLTAQYSYDAQPDSQPFFGTNNFNRTVAKIGTLSIGFSMYAVDTTFYNESLDLIFNAGNVDKQYTLIIKFKSNRQYTVPMKLISVSGTQQIRDFPATSFTFVR